jgi:3,4-dihydroxy 2-butanone 4-phosphate synthase/GTP cyclohydrolase II
MILLSTAPQTIVGLDGYGLEVVEQRDIEGSRHGR